MNLIVPVYNEEKNINKCFFSIINSISNAKIKNWKLYFVLNKNGSTDNSYPILLRIQTNYPKNVRILIAKSNGKTAAQKIAIQKIDNGRPIVFLDCDAFLQKKALQNINLSFASYGNLLVAAGVPVPLKPKSKSVSINLVYKMLNFVSIYPDIMKPQYQISALKQYKNYFNGRFFAIRSKKYWLLKDEKFPDDVLLIDQIYDKYGVDGTFKIIKEAKCYYAPYMKLRAHYLSHLKNYFFLTDLYNQHPNLSKYAFLYVSKINWKYFNKLSINLKIAFLIWCLIAKFESFSYSVQYFLNHGKVDGRFLWNQNKNLK